MIRIANRFFWKILSIAILVLLLYVIYKWTFDEWTIEKVLESLTTGFTYGAPITLFIYIIYKMYIERIILWFNRRKSAKVIADDLPKIVQVSGPVRVGKDSSTVGAAIITKEHILRKERRELKKLQDNLYIYDFEKIVDWLDKNGTNFFVASDKRINNVFTDMIKENDCFIADYWIKKGITPKNHFFSWKYKKDKYIPDVAFVDGITPGGVHFLDMLKKFTILYIYHNFIPNFIMSNQPILESFTIVKKTGRINKLFSKKLSQDFFKLKKDTPIPFPKRGFVIETETAILYSNTDKAEENEIKDVTGIREFYTTAGHILREEVYVYGITQMATRVVKALRELYQGYQHVFRLKFRSTANFNRRLLRLRITFKKLKIFRLKVRRFYKKIYLKFYRERFRKNHVDPSFEKRITKRIHKVRKKISLLSQKEVQLFSKGYVVFYKGIYENIGDVGKRVKFPVLGIIQENKNDNITYSSYGFKQTNKIVDCFGRYDTWFMYTIREIKETIRDTHFTDVPNWDGFKVSFDDINYMNYQPLKGMISIAINLKDQEELERNKLLKKEKQNRAHIKIPEYEIFSELELTQMAKDYIEEFKTLEQTFTFNNNYLIKELSKFYKSNPDLENLEKEELNYLAEDLGIEYKSSEMLITSWRTYITKLLAVEYKKFNGKDLK